MRRFQDLEAWRAADELRREVYALCETGPAAVDFGFRNQIRDAASSAARNIAEGFGRFRPADFARFIEIAIASTMETQDLLRDGQHRKHFTASETLRSEQLAERSLQLSKGLLLYLRACQTTRKR